MIFDVLGFIWVYQGLTNFIENNRFYHVLPISMKLSRRRFEEAQNWDEIPAASPAPKKRVVKKQSKDKGDESASCQAAVCGTVCYGIPFEFPIRFLVMFDRF